MGTDLVLAAFPATPVQVAHALQHLGYDVVVPASWGDELLAAATLARLPERGGTPVVYCACPRVAERLLATGSELAPLLLPLVAPPVAAARYVRAAYGEEPVRITYVGGCPSATDESIDARITPRELLRTLQDRGIVPGDMPRVFEGVIPPDRRRHLSLPGGLPTPEQLGSMTPPRELACLTSADYTAELAQLVLAREPALIDVAARLGCACAGATATTPFERAHATVAQLEPPRASHPVVDLSLVTELDAALPPPRPAPEPAPREAPEPEPRPRSSTPPRSQAIKGTPPRGVATTESTTGRGFGRSTPPESRAPTPAGQEPAAGSSRRRGVTGFFRGYTSAEQPRARTGEGVALPRAYVAKRRPIGEATTPPAAAAPAAIARPEAPRTDERERPIERHVEPAAEGPVAPPAPADLPPAPARRTSARTALSSLPTANAPAPVTPAPVTPPPVAPPVVPSLAAPATPARRATVAAPRRPAAARSTLEAGIEAAPAAPPAPERAAPARAPDITPSARPRPSLPPLPPLRPVPPPRVREPGSGRELLFFVVGALLAGLAFALFR